MIEQLNLFSPPRSEPDPQPKPKAHEYDGTWYRCIKEYRYNENGRPSGWVRQKTTYIIRVNYAADKRQYYATCYENGQCLGWFWISEQDLAEYYEPIWPPEWVDNDD